VKNDSLTLYHTSKLVQKYILWIIYDADWQRHGKFYSDFLALVTRMQTGTRTGAFTGMFCNGEQNSSIPTVKQ
jgi:hypothetical protein